MCRYISNGFLSYDDAKLAIIFHSTKKKVKKITKMFVFSTFTYFLSYKRPLFKQNDTHQRNTFLIPFFVISPPLTTLRKDHTPTVDHAGILFTILVLCSSAMRNSSCNLSAIDSAHTLLPHATKPTVKQHSLNVLPINEIKICYYPALH